ncbi:MAG: Smr/MutS family protein [Sedimenticola sp.]
MSHRKESNRNDDITLFHKEMESAVRHDHDRQTPFKKSLKPHPLPPNPWVTDEVKEDDFVDLHLETGEELLFVRPGIQNRLFHDLQRGRIPPQDMVDLHGLRVVEARSALAGFLTHARRHRLRVIQIIHGKGIGSEGQQPILKQKVNQWLRQRDEVLAFCSAPRFDGGTGATYVLLSRKGVADEHTYGRR